MADAAKPVEVPPVNSIVPESAKVTSIAPESPLGNTGATATDATLAADLAAEEAPPKVNAQDAYDQLMRQAGVAPASGPTGVVAYKGKVENEIKQKLSARN